MEKINLEFPSNADLFDTFEDFGHYAFRTINLYQHLIKKSTCNEEKQNLIKDLYRNLCATSSVATWSKIGVPNKN